MHFPVTVSIKLGSMKNVSDHVTPRAIRQTASHKATGPDEVPTGGTRQNAQNICGDLGN